MRASTRLENKQNYGAICIIYLFLIPKSGKPAILLRQRNTEQIFTIGSRNCIFKIEKITGLKNR